MKTSNRSVLRRIPASMFRVQWYSVPLLYLLYFFVYFTLMSLVAADCQYNNERHQEGMNVATSEPCLNCTCHKGTLLCYLRVCPIFPDPPPPGCILVHRSHMCCPELICADIIESGNNVEARSHPFQLRIPNQEPGKGSACIENGSIYGSGSAMDSSSLCEYCYCLNGKQVCVKPKCLLPIEGCMPIFEETSCCPVQYNCSHVVSSISSTTIKPKETNSSRGGCIIDGISYNQGDKILGIGYSPCDNCYCLRGILRCEPLACAPPLFGCEPVIKPGECCADSYNCGDRVKSSNFPVYVATRQKNEASSNQNKLVNDVNKNYESRNINNKKIDSKPSNFLSELIGDDFDILVNDTLNIKTEKHDRDVDNLTTENYPTSLDFDGTSTVESFTTDLPNTVTFKAILNSTQCISLKNTTELYEATTAETRTDTESSSTLVEAMTEPYTDNSTMNVEETTDNSVLVDITKIKDLEYDYDYPESSLPPSLPNLRIIPFVAADALDPIPEDHHGLNSSQPQNAPAIYNLFSPPAETEGGFVPKEHVYPSVLTSTSTTNSPTVHGTKCVFEGHKVLHGQSLTLETICKTCMCFYGNLMCHKVQCPERKPNCEEVIVEEPNSCCPRYSCNQDKDDGLPNLLLNFLSAPYDVAQNKKQSGDVADLQSLKEETTNSLIPTSTKRTHSNNHVFSDYGTQVNKSTPAVVLTNNSIVSPDESMSRRVSYMNSSAVLKLAGCNIYGRMYRVGRIISELSNPCLECKCTESGVQCKALQC